MSDDGKCVPHKFGYVVFVDPLYKQGWVDRKDLPCEKDAIHVGIGIVVNQTEKAYWFAFAEGLYDRDADIMHPQLIHKDCIIKLYTFTEELFDVLFTGKYTKSIRQKVCKDIDYEISDFF